MKSETITTECSGGPDLRGSLWLSRLERSREGCPETCSQLSYSLCTSAAVKVFWARWMLIQSSALPQSTL